MPPFISLPKGLGPRGGFGGEDTGPLADLGDFGANPGALGARVFLPPDAPEGPLPLVVVLHGCTQTAVGYDRGSGWSQVAAIGGFALLFPEQRRDNNPNLCFNWFDPNDIRRGAGEVASIRQMIAALAARRSIDADRVFVTGLSAGGAMAAAMLATYPDVFAGGAVIAGLPYACAASVPQALKRMRGEGLPDERRLADRLREASGHAGHWPVLSVWHGTADATVHPANARATLAQWRSVHGLAERPDHVETGDGVTHSSWRDAEGRTALEFHEIAGMGHGTPLKTAGPDSCGVAGPFMLDVGLSSTCRIARSWNLLAPSASVEATDAPRPDPDRRASRPASTPWRIEPANPFHPGDAAGKQPKPGSVIETALRQAGLLR